MKGRADIALGRALGLLVNAGVKRVQNPVARAILAELHEEAKPAIDEDLKRVLGPRTKHGRKIAQGAEKVAGFAERVQKRLHGGAA